MRKILALILALLLCVGLIACNNEEANLGSSSSLDSSSDASSSAKPSTNDDKQKQPKKEILDNVTLESLGFYTSYISSVESSTPNDYYHTSEERAKVVSSYEEFLSYVSNNHTDILRHINEETFENNFVVLISGQEGHIRVENVYYSDFEKFDEYYTLTYNYLYEENRCLQMMVEKYSDVCVIPRTLCQDDISSIELKIIRKDYKFEGEIYNSICEVTTYLPE